MMTHARRCWAEPRVRQGYPKVTVAICTAAVLSRCKLHSERRSTTSTWPATPRNGLEANSTVLTGALKSPQPFSTIHLPGRWGYKGAMVDQVTTRPQSNKLTTTSYIILGMIGLRGPSTPYDLKRAVGRSIGYFWPFPHAQIYSEPERLVSAGFLQVELETGGRHRRTYSITSDGWRHLKDWLKTPVAEVFQIRNVAEIKLFFAELGSPSDVVALARQQVEAHRERLATFEAMQKRFANQSELAPRLVPLALGLELERVALKFWESQIPRDERQGQATKVAPASKTGAYASTDGSNGATRRSNRLDDI